jgi:hypothetical protein
MDADSLGALPDLYLLEHACKDVEQLFVCS